MRSSSAEINISAVAPRLDVDNRISLRFYYRIANNILRQADIFRREKNIVDLYIMLLRFSSLVLETIPHHRDYKASLQSQKDLKKKLLDILSELEKLKPVVRQRNIQLEMKQTYQANMQGHLHENDSLEWHAVKNGTLGNYNGTKAMTPASHELSYQFPRSQKQGWPVEEQFRRMSVNFLFPKEETLSKHSIFGPNGLCGPRKPPKSDTRVQYPTNIDFTTVEIPSLHPSIDTGPAIKKDQSNSGSEVSGVEESLTLIDDRQKCHAEDPCSLISFEEPEALVHTNIIRQPSPPAVLAEVQDLIPAMSSQVAEAECRMENSSTDGFVHSESPLQLHISTTMMENFMKLAKSNTDKNLETCGVLAGSLENRKFFVTALIIPKQESTSDTCQTTNEEEIFEVQDKRSLFPLGWIHTHPSQSCFMSSVDLHTHYSYQIMLPEAVAVVMAPRDTSRSHGIFRLTTPGGMSVIRQCQQRGFHSHNQPTDGGPIYASCTDVYMNPNLKFDVIDLR